MNEDQRLERHNEQRNAHTVNSVTEFYIKCTILFTNLVSTFSIRSEFNGIRF